MIKQYVMALSLAFGFYNIAYAADISKNDNFKFNQVENYSAKDFTSINNILKKCTNGIGLLGNLKAYKVTLTGTKDEKYPFDFDGKQNLFFFQKGTSFFGGQVYRINEVYGGANFYRIAILNPPANYAENIKNKLGKDKWKSSSLDDANINGYVANGPIEAIKNWEYIGGDKSLNILEIRGMASFSNDRYVIITCFP